LITPTEALQLLKSLVADHQQEVLAALCAFAVLAFLMSWAALGRSKRLRRRLVELEDTVQRLDNAEERRAMKEMRGPSSG
jgi:hypothetical protein